MNAVLLFVTFEKELICSSESEKYGGIQINTRIHMTAK